VRPGQFGKKYWLLSGGASLLLTLLLFYVSSHFEPVANVVSWPGAELANLCGFGSHDFLGLVLYIFGNLFFYCALFMILFGLLGVSQEKPTKP